MKRMLTIILICMAVIVAGAGCGQSKQIIKPSIIKPSIIKPSKKTTAMLSTPSIIKPS